MHVLVLGAAGMVGRKLIERLAREGRLGERTIAHVTAADVVAPEVVAACKDGPFPMESVVGDFSAPGEAEKLVAGRPDVIFHLAAIVSGEAEADFEKGIRVNLEGTRAALEAARERWPDALEALVGLRVAPDRFEQAFAFDGVKATLQFA
jgi:nucleoside-diphosphate-sugar epimerase